MATWTLPGAIDYFVAMVTALPACAEPVEVSDGFMTVTADASMVLIGIDEQTGETPDKFKWASLGKSTQDEAYQVPCAIYVHSGDNSAKEVRDAASVIFCAILTAVLADKGFGNTLGLPFVAQITNARLHQTYGNTEAELGRLARIYFTLDVMSRFS